MSSFFRYPKNTSNSTFDFKINNINLSSTKVFKNMEFLLLIIKWNRHINYIYQIASTTTYQVFKSFKSTDINILKKLYLVYICPKLVYNTLIWSPYFKKDINHLEYVQRKYTCIIFKHINISYTTSLID